MTEKKTPTGPKIIVASESSFPFIALTRGQTIPVFRPITSIHLNCLTFICYITTYFSKFNYVERMKMNNDSQELKHYYKKIKTMTFNS